MILTVNHFLVCTMGLMNLRWLPKENRKNTEAHGWSPIASHCIEVELKPGESKDFIFVLGYVENKEDEKWESKNIINKKKGKRDYC